MELSKEKTRLIEFGRCAEHNREVKGLDKLETFDFLGFTSHCSQDSRKQFYKVKVKMSDKRLRKKLKDVKLWLKVNRTNKIEEILAHIKLILVSHYNYFGVTDNSLHVFRNNIAKLLFKC